MKKIINCIRCFICLVIIILSVTACGFNGYKGEHTAEYTVAVNNVFAVRGYLSTGETTNDPMIHIIETDNYGRTLFFYSEYFASGSNPKPDFGAAFVVMQKSDDKYAYYYKDKCYTLYFDITNDWNSISKSIDVNILEELKAVNDWNKPFNNKKCSKIEISNQMPEGEACPADYEFDEIIYDYEVKNGYTGEDDSFHIYSIYCEADFYGKELYYVYGMTGNKSDTGEDVFDYYDYAIIINADGSCSKNGIIKISNLEDSMKLINELKRKNNWNVKD